MTSCPNCQAPVGDRARFCGSCGAELTAKSAAFQVEQAAPGAVLKDRYKLVRALPARGSARKEGSLLWEAQDSTTGGRIQLQLLPRALTDHSKHVDELKRLCELWQKTDHPAVVRLERLELEPIPFLVLEHVDAISFEELLSSRSGREQGPFTAEELSTLLPPVGEALDKLAEKGLIHGAVEPGHLLVPDARFGPAARVTMPGVGALIRDALGRTDAGTPGYAAPEQASGKAERRTDVYGLGVTIAHLLTGKHPLASGSADLSAIAAPMRPPLERALSNEPEKRPAQAGMLVRDLVECSRRLKEAPPAVAMENTIRMIPKGEGVSLKLSSLDGPGRVGAPDARAALRATPASTSSSPAVVSPPSSPPPSPAASSMSTMPAMSKEPAPPPEIERTVRFTPGVTDASLSTGAAAQPTPPTPPTPPPAKAAPPPPPPAPVEPPPVERTVRFVPGMADASELAPAAKASPPPPPPVQKAAPPPPPAPPAPPPDLERTIRFVPGMQDSSLAAPVPQAPAPHLTPSHAAPAAAKTPSTTPQTGPVEKKPGEPEGGTAVMEWVLIITLGLIALWQIAKTLG